MPIVTHPGVYIEEIPSGVPLIVGVATSTAAFVDSFRLGPLDTAVRISSFGEFAHPVRVGGRHGQGAFIDQVGAA